MEVAEKPDTGVLVIQGGWNANILLNAEWLKRYLFPDEELDLNFSGDWLTPPRISTKDVSIVLLGPRLSFLPQKWDPDDLEYVETLGTKLADYLPHTPVDGVGVNFVFEIEPEEGTIASCDGEIDNKTQAILQKNGRMTEVVRRYALHLDHCALNLSVRYPTEGKWTYNFNFHHPITDLTEYKELVAENSISEYKNRARAILDELIAVYEDGSEGEEAHG